MITKDIQLCIDALTRGELVAFPTETVFGLGARSDSTEAISKIFEIKGRPTDHPLIAHCSDVDVALAISPDVPDYAKILAKEFWPGPMTLIFKRAGGDAICDEAVGGQDTVAIRVPSHEKARELLAPCGFFVSAPSANKFGRVSPTTAQHVQDEFGDDVLILDGEQSECGLESTIISCVDSFPQILRAGEITSQDILRVTGFDPFAGSTRFPVGNLPATGSRVNPVAGTDPAKIAKPTQIAAPGTLESHYAPSIPVFIVEGESDIEFESGNQASDCALLSFSEPVNGFKHFLKVNSYEQYAHELYGFFRNAETKGCKSIFVVAPEMQGIGVAINDRISKAANSFQIVGK